MKRIFYLVLLGLTVFEVVHVHFIMPMPGSQRIDSLEVAYFLHASRWFIRIALALAILATARAAFRIRHKWLPALATLSVIAIVWFFNFRLSADAMFKQPASLTFQPRESSSLGEDALVLGVAHGGEAKAYPIRYLVYHHQVQDSVGGLPVLVTYCSVCRTGRVFSPMVDGKPETFRLVGMDHWNAMLEDLGSRSWWRQATGVAVAGPRKGERLAELPSTQATLATWLAQFPRAQVMQPDPAAIDGYDAQGRFERGESRGSLTRTDPASWQDKSWVVGIEIGGASKAFDWNRLKELRVINDVVGATPIVLVLHEDGRSFAAFERPFATEKYGVEDDLPASATSRGLKPVNAHQEFWHSWRTFHPGTQRYL